MAESSDHHPVLGLVKDMLPVLTAVAGGIWGLFVYIDNEREARLQDLKNAAATNRTRLIEARQPFLQKQLDLYFETAKILGDLVSADPDSDLWHKSERRFWALYWSELSMVETPALEEAMVECGNALTDFEANRTQDARQALDNTTYGVAHAIRTAIEQSWGAAAEVPSMN